MSEDDIPKKEATLIKPRLARPRSTSNTQIGSEATSILASIDQFPESGEIIDFRSKGTPFLVAEARPLLNLLQHLRDATDMPDLESLRRHVNDEFREYERKLASSGLDAQKSRVAHYIICATVDDVVLSTPWGAQSDWSRKSMVSTFHKDVQGGERFYELLEHYHKDPGQNKNLLLLFYFCLSLGFKGRLRVNARGALELSQIREGLYRTLQAQFGELERELSPNWRGINARSLKERFPLLYSGLLAVLFLCAAVGYILILSILNRDSDIILGDLATMPPVAQATVKVEIPVPTPVQQTDRLEEFRIFLQPEIERGLVTTTRDGNKITVRFRNTGFFAPGSADLSPEFETLMRRVGRAILDEGFSAQVIGHTDSIPIRTVRFPSNWHLSEARAKAVADILIQHVPSEKIRFEGRGETEPVDTNDTPEGREANRRTELVVTAIPQPSAQNATGRRPN